MVDRTGRDNFVNRLQASKSSDPSPEWLDNVMQLSHEAWLFYSLLNDSESHLLRDELSRAHQYCRIEIENGNPSNIRNLNLLTNRLFLRIQNYAALEKHRMKDEEEDLLKEAIQQVDGAPKSKISDIVFDLRIQWDHIFQSPTADTPKLPKAGRKKDRDSAVSTLVEKWESLTVYERGLLMEDAFQLTALSRETVHQVLSAITESINVLPDLLDENWDEIREVSNTIDPARIGCLKTVFEKYWTRAAKSDQSHPFVLFVETVLAVKGSGQDVPNPRRSLEALDDLQPPIMRGFGSFNYISFPIF